MLKGAFEEASKLVEFVKTTGNSMLDRMDRKKHYAYMKGS